MSVGAVRDQTKTVTRRHVDTWRNLKPGDRLTLIEKGMGLPAGTKQVVLAEVEIVSNTCELLYLMTDEECVAEGFPDMTWPQFIRFWCDSHRIGRPCPYDYLVRRIEWRYLP
jgi:hypothetical protein